MAWQGIPITIRHADEGDHTARPMGTCSSDDLDDLPNIVRRWGIEPEGDVVGQFNATTGAFELIVVDKEDD